MKKRRLPFWLPHTKKGLIWYILFAVIFILYHDFWSWGRHQPLVWGWLPGWFLYDILLIIAYVAIAAAFTRFYWPKPPGRKQ
ncbi:MAG: hypothetical protein V3U04_02865 [Candidatus Aerophobetes bacterium]